MAESQSADPDDDHGVRDELKELLEELRVLLPGVQVLFAFLLTVPFSSRFETITDSNRTTYFIAFATAAVASVLLVSPGAIHRILHGDGADRRWLVQVSTRLAIAGSAFLLVAITCVVYLVADVVYDSTAAAVCAAGVAALAAALWFVLPIWKRE